MGELHGDERLREYESGYRMWLIEDGERHWYGAATAYEALQEHEEGFETEAFDTEGGSVEITLCRAGETFILTLEDPSDAEEYPAHWTRGTDLRGRPTVEATHAEWAKHYEGSAEGATQIASSVV